MRHRLLTLIASALAVCLLSTSADAQWWRWFRPRRPPVVVVPPDPPPSGLPNFAQMSIPEPGWDWDRTVLEEKGTADFSTKWIDNTAGNCTDTANANGSEALPRCTIPALTSLAAGSVVQICGGPYSGNLSITGTGTAADPIFVTTEGCALSTYVQINATTSNTLAIVGSYITLDGFQRGPAVNGMTMSTSDHITLRDNKILGTGDAADSGAMISQNSSSNIVRARNIVAEGGDWTSGTENDTHCLGTGTGHTNVWDLWNEVYHCSGDAIGNSHDADHTTTNYFAGGNLLYSSRENCVDLKEINNIILSRNICHSITTSSSSEGAGFIIHYGYSEEDDGGPWDVWMLNNVIHDVVIGIGFSGVDLFGDGTYGDADHGVNAVIGNVIYNCTTALSNNNTTSGFVEFIWYHNTIDDCANGQINNSAFGTFNSGGNIVNDASTRHYITSGTSIRDAVNSIEKDLYYQDGGNLAISWGASSVTYTSMSAWDTAEASVSGLLQADPLFTNEGTRDYTLQSESPAIDAGVDMSSLATTFNAIWSTSLLIDVAGVARPNGVWDVGAYELVTELIPANRLVSWVVGTTVGVPGGIPTGRTQCVTTECQAVTNASADYKDGTTNAATILNAATVSAPANTYVLVPCGLWRMNTGWIVGPSDDNITIRGCDPDDPTATTLDCRMSSTCLFGGSGSDYQFAYPTSNNVVTGYALDVPTGGTVLTIAATTVFNVGNMLLYRVESDPALPVMNVTGVGESRRQMTRVTAKTATTLTVFPPIYGYERFVAAGLDARVNVAQQQTDFFGIEDLALDGTNGNVQYGIWFEQTYGSWVKNVTLTEMTNYNVFMNDSLGCEVRYSNLLELSNEGSNGAGLLMNVVAGCLIEDNIIRESFPNVEINNGSAGNAIVYNFIRNDDGVIGLDINHGPHNSFNLYEGNVAHNVVADGYYGSTSEDTLFRNLFYGNATGTPGYCLALKRFTRNLSMVGNILGSSAHVNACQSFGQPNLGNGSWTGEAQPSLGDFWAHWNQTTTLEATLTARPTNQTGTLTFTSGGSMTNFMQRVALYLIGEILPNTFVDTTAAMTGNTIPITSAPYGTNLPALDTDVIVWAGATGFQELDLDVEATTLKLVNYYFAPTPGIPAGEALPDGVSLPNSLVYTSKPAFFRSLAWPPFTPTSPNEDFSAIPAGYRYENAGADPPP